MTPVPRQRTKTGADTHADHECGCTTTTVSRRRVLQGMGLIGAATAAGPLISSRAAYAASGTWDGNVLVLLSLRGGFDGLSAVAPIGDPDYSIKRPTIAIPASTALAIGDRMFGLHPSLAPLAPLWASGAMAAIHAVGTPDLSRSHFRATDELERAAPGSSVRSGWIDRLLGAVGTHTVFEGVHLGSGDPGLLLAGSGPALAMGQLKDTTLASQDWVGDRLNTALKALHTGSTMVGSDAALTTLAALTTVSDVVARDTTPRNGASYPAGELGTALADAARLIRANVGLQALTIDVDDWDLHSAFGARGTGAFATRLTDVANSLAVFAKDLGSLFDRVTLMTISEFGRRVEENGSGGLDHGHGNAMLILGGGLNGGKVHGTWPGLTDAALLDGDLDGTTDYRSVLSEALTNRCRVPSSALSSIFPGLSPQTPGIFMHA